MEGSTFKRCGCSDQAGNRLRAACPRLSSSGHGSWYYATDLPPTPEGKRRYRRKGGFATRRQAQAALADLLDRVHKGTHVDVAKTTVSQHLRFRRSVRAGWSARSRAVPGHFLASCKRTRRWRARAELDPVL